MKHRHHILPKHAGGDDDPANITPPISLRLHAMFHYDRWRALGETGDYLAWRLIMGHDTDIELARIALLKTPTVRAKMRAAKLGKSRVMHISRDEFSAIMSEAATGRKMAQDVVDKIAAKKRGTKHTAHTKAMMSSKHKLRWAAYTDAERKDRIRAASEGGGFGSTETARKGASARWQK